MLVVVLIVAGCIIAFLMMIFYVCLCVDDSQIRKLEGENHALKTELNLLKQRHGDHDEKLKDLLSAIVDAAYELDYLSPSKED